MRRSICNRLALALVLGVAACGGGAAAPEPDGDVTDAPDGDGLEIEAADAGEDAHDGRDDAYADAGDADGADDALEDSPEIGPVTDTDADADADVGAPALLEDRQGFRSVARVALDSSGVSGPFEVAVSPASAAIFVRVSARDPAPRCFQLDEALTAGGETWVELASAQADYGAVCRHCTQRVSVGQGFGVFQLPNDGRVAVGTSGLTLRVSERDCATALPLSIAPAALAPADLLDVEVLEVGARDAPEDQPLRLPVRFVVAAESQFGDAQGGSDAVIEEAFEFVRAAFAPQGIVPVFGEVVAADFTPADPLVYGADDVSALRASLDAGLGAPAATLGGLSPLTVLVAGCLRRRDPTSGVLRDAQAVTTHVVAGLGPPEVGDGVVLAGHACPSVQPSGYWSGATLGTILAHELGHALGLYHVADGGDVTDNLEDTGVDNLMNADPLGHLNDGFSPSQGVVMRRHPLLRPAPPSAP